MSRNLYKKKGLSGVDPKDKRRLRRSIHQKEVREHGFLTRRIVESGGDSNVLTPVKEPNVRLTTKFGHTKKISEKSQLTKNPDLRKDKLKKWREEKEMKRKIDQMKREKNKPNFKVIKVDHDKPSYLRAADKKTNARKNNTSQSVTTGKVPAAQPVRRSTRIATTKANPAPTSRTRQTRTEPAESKPRNTRGGKTTSGRIPATNKIPTVAPPKTHSKITKIKEPKFPTMSSFTFRKEVPVTLKNAPPQSRCRTAPKPPKVNVSATTKVQSTGRVTRQRAATANRNGATCTSPKKTGGTKKQMTEQVKTNKRNGKTTSTRGKVSPLNKKAKLNGCLDETKSKLKPENEKEVVVGEAEGKTEMEGMVRQTCHNLIGLDQVESEMEQENKLEEKREAEGSNNAEGKMEIEDKEQVVVVTEGEDKTEIKEDGILGMGLSLEEEDQKMEDNMKVSEDNMEMQGEKLGGGVEAAEGDMEMKEEKKVEAIDEMEDRMEMEGYAKEKEDEYITKVVDGKVSASKEKVEMTSEERDESDVSKKDIEGAEHYQGVMEGERDRLSQICSSWEEIMEKDDIPENVCGDIRSAIGKAQLLMNQRFDQFGGLIEQCRLGLGTKRTHTTDLQGFWEMVNFQVEDVDKLFVNISALKENNWVEKEKSEPVTRKTKTKKKTTVKPKAKLGDKKAARERLAAVKAAMKEKQMQKADVVVFDAGFFKIESPVHEKGSHCTAGNTLQSTPVRSRSITPSKSSKRLSLACKEQTLLRAVLQASHTPQKTDISPTDVTDSIFTPERTPDVVTRLQDLGLSTGRKRRRSQRIKSKEEEQIPKPEEVIESNENDLMSYLVPSEPVADSQAEKLMEDDHMDQLDDLGKETPLNHSKASAISPEMICSPSKIPKRLLSQEMSDGSEEGEADAAQDDDVSKENRDGAEHYQGVMGGERQRLRLLCSSWEEVMEKDDIPEDVSGDIRSAIGKAQLLMNQRFDQFGGLIEQCRLGLGTKKTHTTDLQGFWEMVHFQVEDVDGMFANLTTMKENNWVVTEEEKPVVKKVTKKKVPGKIKKITGDKKAARDRLASIKAAMKEKQRQEMVVFDAGFFKVESPAKEKESHCIAGTSLHNSPLLRHSRNPSNSPLLRKSLTPRNTPKRTPLGSKEHDLLRAVLHASHTPKMNRIDSPVNAGSLFSPEEKATPPAERDLVTCLRDLGLSSGRSSTRRRRPSQRRKSTKEGKAEEVEKENEDDLASYLMPSLPVVDLNSQAEELMQTEPLDQLRDLGKRTPLADKNHQEAGKKENGADMKPPYDFNPAADLYDSPKHTPRRSTRLRAGRISAFSPPRRSFANVPPSTDLISFD